MYSISSNQPSEQCIKANAHALARYAAIVQEAKMVPIVEPEVLMDGDHTIDKCYEVTSKVLIECFKELKINNVKLEGTVLKPNMILPGSSCKKKANTDEIAKKTLDCLKNTNFNFTFSYGRALQQSALKTWSKSMQDTKNVQKVFDHRAKMNSASTEGKWEEKFEKNFAA